MPNCGSLVANRMRASDCCQARSVPSVFKQNPANLKKSRWWKGKGGAQLASAPSFTFVPRTLRTKNAAFRDWVGRAGQRIRWRRSSWLIQSYLHSTSPFVGTLDVNVAASACGAPASAQSYVLNATVVPPGSLGYLTLWAQGAAQPFVSTLNAADGTITSNMAIVPTTNGSVSAFTQDPTHLVLDISAYFAP